MSHNIDAQLAERLTLDRGKIADLPDESLDSRIRQLTEVIAGYDSPDKEGEAFRAAVEYIGAHPIANYRAVLRTLRKEKRARMTRPGGYVPKVVPWTDFVRLAPPNAEDFDTPAAWARYRALSAKDPSRTPEEYRDVYLSMMDDEHYDNSRYRVILRRSMIDIGFGPVEQVHLSIKRVDQQTIHDWRDLQRIKDELVGPNCEGIELYPAADRVVDTANQYHLWCINHGGFRFPFGFNEGRMTLGPDENDAGAGIAQRAFEA